jgi:SAM-dependent methyltransferase
VSVLFTDAKELGFRTGSFDVAICGFMGWSDCFDFDLGEFTHPDRKATGIWRVLRDGGRFVCCSWERQDDLSWMEDAIIRHYPAILEDPEFLSERPVGMARENAEGYQVVLQSAGFKEIQIHREVMAFVSRDEEEWWRQMLFLGWDLFLDKLEEGDSGHLREVKEDVLSDLQEQRREDGIHFDKTVVFVSGIK